MQNNNLEIFSVEKYKMFKKDMITKTGTIEQICEEVLKNNKGYHLNYNPEDKVILFGDIDHIINEETFFKIKLKIEDYFNIEDIDYTKSIKENELSYHWSFNNYCTTVENLKNHMIKFIELNKDFLNTEIIDISIYNKNSWFRLPNQTNKDKPFIHKIVNGNMESFIVNYVPNDCEEFEILIEEKSNNKSIKNDNLNITRYENLLKCLSYYRCNNYNDWLRVKFILNNELGTEGYNIFDEWSQKSEKYDKDETYNFYNDIKIKDDGLKIGTLIKMAKEDNLELYNQLFKNNNNTNNKSLFDEPLTTRSLGNHFKSLYGDKFIYQNSKLYYFNSIYWESEDIKEKLININNFIADVYFNDVMDLCKKYENNELNKEKIDKSELIKKMNGIRNNLLNLLNYNKRQELINDLFSILCNNEIKFDENPYLFAFKNKIFDLKKCKFIEPKPEQYISMTTGYNYIEKDETENIKELNKLIDSIFPDKSIKKLYLTILSTGMDGINLEKFILANGGGGNGKGLLNEFCQYMLGDYAYVLPVNILLGPLKTGSNPEIANMNNKRFVIAREPDRNLMFNCATIKELTGGNEINARLNHSNNTKTKLKLTFLLECNDKPKLNEVNDALSRRILDIPFKNKFVDIHIYNELDEKEKENTFLINSYYKTLEFKDNYKQALFLILTEHYKEFDNNERNLIIPDEIIKRNREYLQNSDEFLNWFNDKYQKTENKKDTIKLKIIYEEFKNSEYFENLNKVQKRQNNYKNFVEKLQNNMFLKRYVTEDKDKTNIITNYTYKINDEENQDDSINNPLDK